MQNKYVGDYGDLGKDLLLKSISHGPLRLGVNWCLVSNEAHKNDGKKLGYLNKKSSKHKGLDEDIFNKLKHLVNSSKRSVESIRESGILPPSTMYYEEPVPIGLSRFAWHDKSLAHFSNCDIIFYDPDNGLEISSIGRLHSEAIKYVFFEEIRHSYHSGKSIIIFQHANQNGKIADQIKQRKHQLMTCLAIPGYQIDVHHPQQGATQYYLIIKQPIHFEVINKHFF